jgi:membrane protein
MERAAALTYTSLLAMVPLLAVSFAIFSAFPAFENMKYEVQEFAFKNFVPEIGSSLFSHVEKFTSKTGQLTGIGVVFLGVTPIMLLSSIGNTFNAIWRVTESRAIMARLLAYWTVLTLTPLLFGASLSLSSYFFAIAKSSGVTSQMGITNLASLLPLFMQIVGFTILYLVIPYFPVRRRDALIGGFTAGVLFELLKKGFGLYISHFPTYQTIYGALAMVPIFLIWMYVAWGVVLFGAELSASLPEWRAGLRETRHGKIRPARILIAALSVLRTLLIKSQHGGGIRARDLMRVAGTATDAVTEATNVLTKQKYIAKGEGGTWLLARDLEIVTLADLHTAFQLTVEPRDLLNMEQLDWGQRLAERMDALNLSGAEVMSVSLKELLGPAEGAEIIDFPEITGEVEILDRKSKWLAILGLTWISGS